MSILLALAISLLPSLAFCADFTGKVVSVIDGDSIRVMHEGKAEQIRLSGIDCPEKGQSFGKRAKQATSSLSFGKNVSVQPMTKDRYGRTVANMHLRETKTVTGKNRREKESQPLESFGAPDRS